LYGNAGNSASGVSNDASYYEASVSPTHKLEQENKGLAGRKESI